MTRRKVSEWTDIKELTPLQFMPYVARLFFDVTGQDLQGLSQFMRWIGRGGYYHWRVVQLGQTHLVPHLHGQPTPRPPTVHPSGQPLPLRPTRTETPAVGVSGKWSQKTQTTPGGGGQGPTPSQGSQTAATGGQPTAPCQGQPTVPRQGRQLARSSGSARPAASEGPPPPPSGNRGGGDNTGTSWYEQTIREAAGPPYPIGTAEARRSAIGHIYDHVSGKSLPEDNIVSEALWAYFTRVDASTLNTWACQVLCMIAEYHMALVTRGSAVTSPLLPQDLV